MSLKLKALIQLAGLVAVSVLISVAIQYINTYVSKETLTAVFEYSLIGGLLYGCYNLILTRLEFNEKYKELDK
jgi:hypothetical protein